MNKTACVVNIKTDYKEAKQIITKNHIDTNLILERKHSINTSKLEGNVRYISTAKPMK